MKFIITTHPDKKEAKKTEADIINWLKKEGHEVVGIGEGADLAIVLGGDGYIMHSVSKFSPRGIPTLGINAGEIGFLTNGTLFEWEDIMKRVVSKKFIIEKRLGLELLCNGANHGPYANDIYLKHSISIASFKVVLNGNVIYKELSSDGLIVSTPTGSTGYNVSVGGSIIQPGVVCILLTPISSGQLNVRPLVVNPESIIEIEMTRCKKPGSVSLVADGKIINEALFDGEKINIKQHKDKLLFAVLDHHDFYKALQSKKGLMS